MLLHPLQLQPHSVGYLGQPALTIWRLGHVSLCSGLLYYLFAAVLPPLVCSNGNIQSWNYSLCQIFVWQCIPAGLMQGCMSE